MLTEGSAASFVLAWIKERSPQSTIPQDVANTCCIQQQTIAQLLRASAYKLHSVLQDEQVVVGEGRKPALAEFFLVFVCNHGLCKL